jgi:hypothetical protein
MYENGCQLCRFRLSASQMWSGPSAHGRGRSLDDGLARAPRAFGIGMIRHRRTVQLRQSCLAHWPISFARSALSERDNVFVGASTDYALSTLQSGCGPNKRCTPRNKYLQAFIFLGCPSLNRWVHRDLPAGCSSEGSEYTGTVPISRPWSLVMAT